MAGRPGARELTSAGPSTCGIPALFIFLSRLYPACNSSGGAVRGTWLWVCRTAGRTLCMCSIKRSEVLKNRKEGRKHMHANSPTTQSRKTHHTRRFSALLDQVTSCNHHKNMTNIKIPSGRGTGGAMCADFFFATYVSRRAASTRQLQ